MTYNVHETHNDPLLNWVCSAWSWNL